jgi:hypothetical protein
MRQVEGQLLARSAVAQQEAAGGTEAERPDSGRLPECRFVVAVPADAVLAVSVKVCEHRVRLLPGHASRAGEGVPNTLAKLGKGRWPGPRGMVDARVAVADIAIPGRQAGQGHSFCPEAGLLLLPVKAREELFEQGVGVERGEPAAIEGNLAVAGQQVGAEGRAVSYQGYLARASSCGQPPDSMS